MSPTVESPSRVSFGLYEADLQTGELWKAGIRIKIQSQPFKVLSALLERPGEVVTREELQLRLWGKDTTVDFDHSLGTAVNKIREALGDSADNPRFVETLARRGYRFIAPVSFPPGYTLPRTPDSAAPSDSEASETPTISSDPSLTHSDSAPPATLSHPAAHPAETSLATSAFAAPSRRHLALYTALACGAFLLAIVGAYLLGIRNSAAPIPRITQITHNGRISPSAAGTEDLPATATDGVRVFASVIENGRPALSQILASTGDIRPLDLPSEIAAPSLGDLSPDGSRLLVRSHLSPVSEQALWIVPASGGSALRIANVLAHDATWMPDGNSILYATGNDLYVTQLSGGSPTHYASLPGRAFWLRWSPNHKLLRFTIINPIDHTLTLWELPAGAATPHPVLPNWSNPATECCGSWTGDGKYFVFQSSHDGATDLWRLKANSTSNPVKLTNGPLAFEAPVAAPDGQRIFFIGIDARSELERFSPALKQFVPQHNFLSAASRVDYSRDAQWVAWTDAQGRLWRAHADGSAILQLTPSSMQVFLAHWSPDASRLAIMAREPGKAWQIYLISADGSSITHLLPEPRNQADPAWSPDGNTLAFGRVPDLMGKESGPRQIQLLNLQSHQLQTIPNSLGLFSPRWSPDGRYIAAISLDQRRLLLFDTSSHTWHQLADTSVEDPVWSSDSRAVFFHAFEAPTQPIYRASVSDGHLDAVASLTELRASDAADYFFTGLTPDNTPLIRARFSTGNLYSLDPQDK
jgi:Tol biopolymer transport system component/DNA-binding winged helix-turn-helix (wHTH) protein